jgi:hypothetical protein
MANQTVEMLEHTNQRSLRATAVAQPALGNSSTARVRSSSFKYYIHDSCAALRLKLIGELTQGDIAELNGCWRTARTTLANRKLVLDLRSLKTVDATARDWLGAMAQEGACYLPEDFLATCVPGEYRPRAEADLQLRKPGLLSRLAALFRGASVPAESSTTQAP